MILRTGWTPMALLAGLSGVFAQSALAGEGAVYCPPGGSVVNVDRATNGDNPGVTMVIGGCNRSITLQVVNQVIAIDPQANYLHRGRIQLDDNHFILQAQRLHASLMAEPVSVIRGAGVIEREQVAMMKPLLIIPIRRQDGNPLDGNIPMVPEPASGKSRLMVSSQ